MSKTVAVILAKNEAHNLPHTLGILNTYKKEELISEIIVVNDGSTDSTVEVARKFGATVIRNKFIPGKRGGFVTGAFAAKKRNATSLVLLDADIVNFPKATIKQMISAVTQDKKQMALARQYEEVLESTPRDKAGTLSTTPQSMIGIRSFSILGLNPLFVGNKKWKELLFAKEASLKTRIKYPHEIIQKGKNWGLEEALDLLITPKNTTLLENSPVITKQAFRRDHRPDVQLAQISGGLIVEYAAMKRRERAMNKRPRLVSKLKPKPTMLQHIR